MTKEEHLNCHIKLHENLDKLVGDYINCTVKTLTRSSIMDLMQWSHEQTKIETLCHRENEET